MRVLMLGNSYTFYHGMPDMLADILGCEVTARTRGGARLAEQLNPDTKLGAGTRKALREEAWDYVVLQEMSNGPITARRSFFRSVSGLCGLIRENGAVPVLYATWAYQRDSVRMAAMDCAYDAMYRMMYGAYHEAAAQNQALVADVGKRFYELSDTVELYMPDGSHPTERGARIAAEIIAGAIREDRERRRAGQARST